MSSLLVEHEGASAWAERTIDASRNPSLFGSFMSGVGWAEDGNPLEGQGIEFDPKKLVGEINKIGHPLLLNHDPGKPLGRVIAAELFQAGDCKKFVGIVLGLYAGAEHVGFADFPFDFGAAPLIPRQLPDLSDDYWVELATDPREVDAEWVRAVADEIPLTQRSRRLSHNAADATSEIIRVTLPYVAMVWNPLVTKIASKAGEEVYGAMRKWIAHLFRKLAERKNPITILQASSGECDVYFIVRGNDIDNLTAARDGLEAAAAQAHHLIQVMERHKAPLRELFYEFNAELKAWQPSYGVMKDGRLITDNRTLMLAEKMPKGLSLGLGGFEED